TDRALEEAIHALIADLAAAREMARRGERLRDGMTVAILGAPNVGKSTLLNALAGRDVAIVSDRPGTTRDAVEARLEVAGVPITLVDTAGIRTTDDPLEAEGVRRAHAKAGDAD
ncbi:GTPase, partial [Stenotrophomonas sp. A3_2]|uniref:GTPase n=1 Tax=Stenotrophomonas sp. A3_2 TaxID=3119978 RepID=UPI002FC320E9